MYMYHELKKGCFQYKLRGLFLKSCHIWELYIVYCIAQMFDGGEAS